MAHPRTVACLSHVRSGRSRISDPPTASRVPSQVRSYPIVDPNRADTINHPEDRLRGLDATDAGVLVTIDTPPSSRYDRWLAASIPGQTWP